MNLDKMTLLRRIVDWKSCRQEIEKELALRTSIAQSNLQKLDAVSARLVELEDDLKKAKQAKNHIVGFVRAAFQLDRPNPQETIRKLVEKK